MRLASLILGLALLGLLLFFGLVAAGVLLIGGCVLLVWRYWKRVRGAHAPATAAPTGTAKPTVLEGEFTVLRDQPRDTP